MGSYINRAGRLRSLRLGIYLVLALTGAAALAGCACGVPAARTLPSYIKRIYIPTFRNQSREFGLQAPLTLAIHDAFLSDGRLDPVDNERADVRIEGKIDYFREEPTSLSSDRFPTVERMEMACTVELWDPYDADRVAPLYRYKIPAVIQYVSDTRRSIAETRTEARARLLDQMAQNIVNTILTGGPIPLTPIEQRGIDRYRERKGPQNYEPIDIDPRYPDASQAPDVDL